MSTNIFYSKYKIKAGRSMQIPSTVSFIFCLSATEPFYIQFDNGSLIPFKQNIKMKVPEKSDFIYLVNKSGGAIDVELVQGDGDYLDGTVNITGDVSIKEKRVNVSDVERFTIDGSGEKTLDPLGADKIFIQSATQNHIHLFKNDGLFLLFGEMLTLPIKEPFKVFGLEGDKFVFGRIF